jgi:hypothetical protein
MEDIFLDKIEQDCYLVSKGVRAVALLQFRHKKNNDVDKIIKITKRHNVKYELKPFYKDGWTELWIFENDIVRYIINELPDKPILPSDHYILGKLFGYSDEKIFRFCKQKAGLNDPRLNDVTSNL